MLLSGGLLSTGYALRVWRIARQTSNLQDEVRLLGGALDENRSSGCDG